MTVGPDNTFTHGVVGIDFDPEGLPFDAGDWVADKYEVSRVLGIGGMTFVASAKPIDCDRVVALKFLRPPFLADANLVDRFTLQARAVAKIENDHVARILDVDTTHDGAPFVVMEYLEGKDLGTLLREEGPAPLSCAVEYLLEGCEALAAAHARRIIHRDVRPENLFLARSAHGLGAIQLLDLGISKLALTGSALEGSGLRESQRSAVYMSPEQIRASNDVDARTDVWSLGCVLYELLTGHTPFEECSITLLTVAILERPAPHLRERRPDLPVELEAVLARCLAKNPDHRFQTVSQLAAALYPFAPRRARLSVERCSQILRHAGVTPAPLVLSSIPPPSKVPADLAKALQPASESTTRTSDEPTHVDMSEPTPSTSRRWRAPLLASSCISIAAAAFVLVRSSFPTMFGGTGSIATVIEEASPAAPAMVDLSLHTSVSADTAETRISPEASAALLPHAPSAAPTPKAARESHKGHSQTGTSEEIDVGF